MTNDPMVLGHTDDLITASLRLTASMVSEEDTYVLLRRGLALCVRVLDCDRGMVIAGNDAGDHRVVERTGGTTESWYSTTAIRLVGEKRKPLLISDTIEHELLGGRESINQHDIRSVLCSLLDVDRGGVDTEKMYLYLDSHTDRRPFSEGDLEKFRLLSSLMGSLVERVEQIARQEATIEELKSRMEERQFEDLIFGSEAFAKCLELVRQAAPTDVPMLLLGETGTGKEMIARVVHKLSAREKKPFLAVNCGAIPGNLVESQLFGHERGAFTGAVSSRKGFFEEADGGTLFLDEVGELPADAQAHFLRVLQENEIVRVGSAKPTKVDVRIVAATNVDLEQAVRDGTFRSDLYYRLNVLPVVIPPVRERGEDSLLLARFFLDRYAQTYGKKNLKLSRDAEKSILTYDWPGNVREIQNRMQRVAITASSQTIDKADLGLAEGGLSNYSSLRDAREAVDREMISKAMSRSPGNLTNAAKILDIDRKSLRILLEKYGISY